MSAQSKMGNAQIHEAGDQRNPPQRFHEGQENSHQSLDSKDERTIANRLANAERGKDGEQDSVETQRVKQDPLLPAQAHGNEPSRGAKVDAEIRAEEEEELKNKGKI